MVVRPEFASRDWNLNLNSPSRWWRGGAAIHHPRRTKNGVGGTIVGTQTPQAGRARGGGVVLPLLLSAAAFCSLLGIGWTVLPLSSSSVPTTRGVAAADVGVAPPSSMSMPPPPVGGNDGGGGSEIAAVPRFRRSRHGPAEPQHRLPPQPQPPAGAEAKAGGRPCESLYLQSGGKKNRFGVEHSPLLFERDDLSNDRHPPLLVCRTPKIGSTELRLIKKAYEKRSNFTSGAIPILLGPALFSVANVTRFDRLLHSPHDVTRIMFVRHPVRRILSGFLQVATNHDAREFWTDSYDFWAPLGNSPAAFRRWVFNSTFAEEYDRGTCRDMEVSTAFSMDRIKQHFLPAQHCRCGVSDCGVEWTRFKIDDDGFTSIAEVVGRHVPGPWIPPPAAPRINAKRYREGDYLTGDVLDFLNDITRVEREEFGYGPLVVAQTKKPTERG